MAEKKIYERPELQLVGSIGNVTLATSTGTRTDLVKGSVVTFGPDGPEVLS